MTLSPQGWETWRRASRPLSPSLYYPDLGLPHYGRASGNLGPKSRPRKPPQASLASEGLCSSQQQLPSPVFAGSKHRQSPACPRGLIQISKITGGIERTNSTSLEAPSNVFSSFFFSLAGVRGGVGMSATVLPDFFQS